MSKARKKSTRTRKSTAKPIQQALRRWAGGSSLLAALLVVLAATGMFPLSSLPPNIQDWLSLLTGRHAPPTASNTSNQNQSATAGKGRHYGQVERVSDGDTLTFITTEGARLKVRLASIDAPETAHGNARKGQAFGEQSGQSLREMAQGKRAELECFEVDRYQRSVCRVIVDGVDVNAKMRPKPLKEGYGVLPGLLRLGIGAKIAGKMACVPETQFSYENKPLSFKP